jgi:hypothetical protein
MMAPDRMWAPGSEPFLEHDHRDLLALLGGQLLEPDRGGQAGRAATHDDDVVLHGFAGAELGKDLVVGHDRAGNEGGAVGEGEPGFYAGPGDRAR